MDDVERQEQNLLLTRIARDFARLITTDFGKMISDREQALSIWMHGFTCGCEYEMERTDEEFAQR